MNPDDLEAARGPTAVAVVVGGLMLLVQLYTAVLKVRRFRRVASAQALKHEAEARRLQAEAEAVEAEGEVREVEADVKASRILRKQLIAINRRMTRLERKHDEEVAELRKSNKECEERATEQGRFIVNLQRQEKANQLKMEGLVQLVQTLKAELRARGWVDPSGDYPALPPSPPPQEPHGTGPA